MPEEGSQQSGGEGSSGSQGGSGSHGSSSGSSQGGGQGGGGSSSGGESGAGQERTSSGRFTESGHGPYYGSYDPYTRYEQYERGAGQQERKDYRGGQGGQERSYGRPGGFQGQSGDSQGMEQAVKYAILSECLNNLTKRNMAQSEVQNVSAGGPFGAGYPVAMPVLSNGGDSLGGIGALLALSAIGGGFGGRNGFDQGFFHLLEGQRAIVDAGRDSVQELQNQLNTDSKFAMKEAADARVEARDIAATTEFRVGTRNSLERAADDRRRIENASERRDEQIRVEAKDQFSELRQLIKDTANEQRISSLTRENDEMRLRENNRSIAADVLAAIRCNPIAVTLAAPCGGTVPVPEVSRVK